MIRKLPLLPPDWVTWKWDEGNLSATTEQTQQSHNTLLEKGLCANFSRFVWNDIVDLTANALDIAGIGWDSKYGNVESCKISEHMGALMANKFNGVAININRLGLFKWKWEVNSKDPGYLGRPHVYGASTHGSKADNIYAWYILELTDRLNWFLSILKDEADFVEQHSSCESKLFVPSKMSSVVTVPSRSYDKILSQSYSKPSLLRVLQHRAMIECNSFGNSVLLSKNERAIFGSNIVNQAHIDAVSRTLFVRSLRESPLVSNTKQYAKMNDMSRVRYMRHNQVSRFSTLAVMEANIQDLYSSLNAVAFNVGRVTAAPEKTLYVTPYIESSSYSTLNSDPILLMRVGYGAKSQTDSVLDSLCGYSFEVNPIIASYSDVEIGLKRIGAMRSMPFMETIPSGLISMSTSSAVYFDKYSISSGIAKAKTIVSRNMRLISGSSVYCTDELSIRRTVNSNLTQYSNAEIDATMYAKRLVHGASILHIESNFVPINLVPCKSTKKISVVESGSYTDAIFEKGVTQPIDAIRESKSFNIAALQRTDVEKIIHSDCSDTLVEAQIEKREIEKICTAVVAAGFSHAVLENGAKPKETWYDPVQTGSNLYIRSVDSSYQDDEKAYIDLSVFYEPKQIDNNLYIRSIASVWTDGNAANIDTAFFLEPVQEDNNLYIRQDIFGGE